MTVIATGTFDTAEVGIDKTVTVVYSSSNSNYKILPESETFTASILERPVSASGILNVCVDGELLTEGVEYNWVNGKVVLTTTFVDTLEEGEHTLVIEFTGNTVDEDFSIVDGIVISIENAKYLAV